MKSNKWVQPRSVDLVGVDLVTYYFNKALEARKVIQCRIENKPLVSYGTLMQNLDVNRFEMAQILGMLVCIDTKAGSGLWSSFVTYKDGTIGEDFFNCAFNNGYRIEDQDTFLAQQRGKCLDSLPDQDQESL